MSKYTTELRYICEEAAGLKESVGYGRALQVIEQARTKIFDFDYPIFDQDYKAVLETKILKHFYTQEIGCETAALWKWRLNTSMNEIMPYYNMLYKNGMQIINPFWDTDLQESMEKAGTAKENSSNSQTREDSTERTNDITRTDSGTITDAGTKEVTTEGELSGTVTGSGSDTVAGQSAAKNVRWDKYADTPQGAVTNLDNDTYLTNARKITDDGSGSTTSQTTTYGKTDTSGQESSETQNVETEDVRTLNTKQLTNDRESGKAISEQAGSGSKTANTTETYLIKKTGRSGVNVVERFMQARDTILDVDNMILADLQCLFMGLW